MDPKATSARSISVIIPVYGESAIINRTVRQVRESAVGRETEIVVADGGPGHRTLAALNAPDVIGVCCPPGRGVQMNAGAAVATGDVLLFLHADTLLPDNWPDAVDRAFDVGRARAGAFSLAIDSHRLSLAVVARFANLRTRLERIPYGDQAPFIQRALFRELGGFEPIPIMEDVDLFRRLKRGGQPIAVLKERVLTSARRWEKDGVVRRTLGNWRLRLRYALGAAPDELARFYKPDGDE
ncbi:TIGR04283 family arsenosugar biosynthesis glycosyltransferase [uncultured Pseudodesulfovibrio sp.]|uniref:TIGR04283 family arsenosugar biosynthesis glycosyltransferase n=1 Tax=uncultured Pseudodesulfovibrio sp. TaxID=2035858 RepID=UPI0029C61E99|nr:TIGR04283 family arsenosugar biosynthesis glycosyltransferase [uncultured Pseudodesulfovibrio sp.]